MPKGSMYFKPLNMVIKPMVPINPKPKVGGISRPYKLVHSNANIKVMVTHLKTCNSIRKFIKYTTQ